MSLFSALDSAISGLKAQSSSLSAISANIANSSTAGYKTEQTSFASMIGDADSGSGVSTTNTPDMATQGGISSSSQSTNMAISGAGFFVVSDSATDATPGSDVFTRNGTFAPDADGHLVNSSGDYLLGYATDPSGVPVGAGAGTLDGLSVIDVPNNTTVAATTTASLQANLPADLAVGGSVTNTIQVVDAQGVTQTVKQTFTKTAANTWTMALANPYSTDPSVSTGTIAPASVTINFDGNGLLTGTTPSPVAVTLTGLTSGAANSAFTLNLGTVGKLDGLTQYASNDGSGDISITGNTHDGSSQGTLASIAISQDGLVSAKYSNGSNVVVAKVPIATFADQQALTMMSGSDFTANISSGTAMLSSAGSNGAGSISGSALEASGTDTATEFNKMIVAQQAYSAAAQVVTYVDKMFNSLIQAIG